MSTFDVRKDKVETIESIRWCASGDHSVRSWDLVNNPIHSIVYIREATQDSTGRVPLLESKEDAQNLIKAIEKCIQLGWVE